MSDTAGPAPGDRPGAPWPPPAPGDGRAGEPAELLPSVPRRPFAALADASPRELVALATVVAGALAVLAALVPMVLGPGVGGGGVVARLQAGTSVVGLPVVLLVPLALVLLGDRGPLAHPAEGATPGGAADVAVLGALGVGAACSALALVGLVTDLVDAALPGSTRVVALLLDLAVLVVALAATWWAVPRRARPVATGAGDDRGAPAGGVALRPADPGWGRQPPVWPTRPPTGPPTSP